MLQPELQEMVHSIVGRLRALSPKSDGLFIAVDLKLEVLEQECQGREATGQKKLL